MRLVGMVKCPYCSEKYKDVKQHIIRGHPEKEWPPTIFGNETPCNACNSTPTRVTYGETPEEDKYFCQEHSSDDGIVVERF